MVSWSYTSQLASFKVFMFYPLDVEPSGLIRFRLREHSILSWSDLASVRFREDRSLHNFSTLIHLPHFVVAPHI